MRIRGDLISTQAPEVRAEIFQIFESEGREGLKWDTLRLDMAAATMLDSVGLNLLVTLLKRVQKRNARMQIVYSCPNVLRTIKFTRLDKHIEMIKV